MNEEMREEINYETKRRIQTMNSFLLFSLVFCSNLVVRKVVGKAIKHA